jgi:pilus assembly protein Flp/PilA
MNYLKQYLLDFSNDESGQDLIEYALIAAIISLGSIAAIKNIGTILASTFNSVSDKLSGAV